MHPILKKYLYYFKTFFYSVVKEILQKNTFLVLVIASDTDSPTHSRKDEEINGNCHSKMQPSGIFSMFFRQLQITKNDFKVIIYELNITF